MYEVPISDCECVRLSVRSELLTADGVQVPGQEGGPHQGQGREGVPWQDTSVPSHVREVINTVQCRSFDDIGLGLEAWLFYSYNFDNLDIELQWF